MVIQQDYWADTGEEPFVAIEEGEEVTFVGRMDGYYLVKGSTGITWPVPPSYF